MRKRSSTAALGLRLTWVAALTVIISICALQAWLFWRQQSLWGGVEFTNYVINLENIIENYGIARTGKWGFIAMLLTLTHCCNSPQTSMTLRRLRIREWEVCLIWTAVFAGWFLLLWAVQILMLLGMFAVYAEFSGLGNMDLFLMAYDSPYFHLLLPLSEPWGVARNLTVGLIFSATASLCGLHLRHGGKPYMLAVVAILTGLFLPKEMASATGDMVAIPVLTALLAAYIWTVKGVLDNED